MKNRFLSIFAAIAVTLSLSACQNGDTEQNLPLSDMVVSEATQGDVTTQISEINESYDPYDYPVHQLPDEWTFEKICNLFEIDGVPLSLEYNDEDFEKINDNIEVVHDDVFVYDYDVLYYDEFLLTYVKPDDDKCISGFSFGYVNSNQEIINSVTFAGYPLTESEKIYNYLDEHFTISYENENTKSRRYLFENDNSILKLDILCYSEHNPTRLKIWFSITEKEMHTND